MISSKTLIYDFFLIVSVIISIVFIGFLGLINLFPILILFIAAFLVFIKKPEMVLILFLLSMTTNNIIPKEEFIFGFIGVQQSLALFSFFLIIKSKKIKSMLDNQGLKLVNKFIIFILLYSMYTVFKNVYFNIFDATMTMAITRGVNFSFLMYLIYAILSKLKDSRAIFFRASLSSVVFLGITTFISKHLIPFGYYISIDGENLDRYNGFAGNGDANTLALIMVMGVGLMLNYSLVYGWKKYFTIPLIISLATIGLTGSRSGLVLLALVVIIYFLNQRDFKKVVNGLFVLIVLSLLAFPLFKTNLERFQDAKKEQTDLQGTSNRIGKWAFYLKYFSENPRAILVGGDQELKVGWNGIFLVAHNIYIQIVYNSGIFFLLYYISILIKAKSKRKTLDGNILILLIPLIIGTGFISDYGSILFYTYSIVPFIKLKSVKQ